MRRYRRSDFRGRDGRWLSAEHKRDELHLLEDLHGLELDAMLVRERETLARLTLGPGWQSYFRLHAPITRRFLLLALAGEPNPKL